MTPTIFTCEQYSDDWWKVRRGVPTASEAGRIITPKKGELAAAHDGYISALIGDLLDAEYPRKDDVATGAMRRGTALEPKARRMYEFEQSERVLQVGFVLSGCGRFGCSPDGLVGNDGGLELKNPAAGKHVEWVRAGVLPDDYKAQVHMSLIVTGRAWWDFASYLPGQDLFVVRTTPDAFTAKLRECLDLFWDRYQFALDLFRPSAQERAA